MADDRDRLNEYLQQIDETQAQSRRTKSTDGRVRRVVKHAVPVSVRGTARMRLTDAVRPLQRRRARRIAAGAEPLRLHLGSGGEPKAGWVNVDFVGDPVELAWNLAHGIPFADASVEAIFHEHLLEHISLTDGARFMDEAFRVLQPGGILRIGVPDAGELVTSYGGDGTYLEGLHPGRPTKMLALQELFYWHRHMTMYDTETLALLFRAAGFPEPQQRKFGDTAFDVAPDTPRRETETLYMEASKPLGWSAGA